MKRLVLSMAMLVMVIGVLKLTPVTVAGQTPSLPAKAGVAKDAPALKTEWGEPDLQGIWLDEYRTPFERPPQYAGREFFTDAERAALDAKRAKVLNHDYRATRGTVADVGGAYNDVYRTRKHMGRRTSLIVDPPDGKMPPYTPDVLKRREVMREFQAALLQAAKGGPPSPRFNEPAPIYPNGGVNRSDGPEDHGLIVRCLAGYVPAGGNGPGFDDAFYHDVHRIVQTPGGVSMFYETGQGQSFQRNIVMNGSPHLPSTIHQWWGDSRGHWEGNTLVIDVTNFSPKVDFLGARENLHVVERFTRTGPTTIEYAATLEDPTTWTKPWTVKRDLDKQDEYANRVYSEPRCHEGNYGLPGLLRGARMEDKAFAEGRGPNPAEICQSGCGGSNSEDREPVDGGEFELK